MKERRGEWMRGERRVEWSRRECGGKNGEEQRAGEGRGEER